MPMKNMLVRALSGSVYVAMIIGATLAGQNYFFALIVLFTVLGMVELQKLLNTKSEIDILTRILDILAALSVIFGIYGTYAFSEAFAILFIVLPVLYIPLRMVLAVSQISENPSRATMYSIFSLIYIALPLLLLLSTYCMDWQLVLLTFVMIWLNDTGAYIVGVSIGKHRLCERLSPKKSWEGFWGGFTFCVAAGVSYSFIFADGANWLIYGIYAALVSILSTYGDLFESMIKRTVGVKDSGNLIPGHGGILDRIDSLLAVAPLSFIMTFLLNL